MRGSCILAAMALVCAAPAFAVAQVSTPVTFAANQLGSRYTINYSGYSAEVLRPYLTAVQTIRLASVNAAKTEWTFNIVNYKNTTSAPATQARLAGFGFDVTNAVLSSATITNAGFLDTVVQGGTFPQIGPSANIEVCFTPGNQCSAGGNSGLNLGQSLTTGTFVLKFASALQSITLNNFTVRYNAIVGAGTEPSGSGLVAGNVFVEVLPEPGTWVQMIAGFGLIGAARRRQRRAIAA
jgi:hypothetical protein